MLILWILSTFLLVQGQQVTLANGNYFGITSADRCSGCLPDHITAAIICPSVTLDDGTRLSWSLRSWQANGYALWDTTTAAPANNNVRGVPIADSLTISYVGEPKSTIDFQPPSLSNWKPFTKYWNYLLGGGYWQAFDPITNPAVPTESNFPVIITSSPPCLFNGNVGDEGSQITLYVVQCAYQAGYWPDATITSLGDSVMEIYIPWPYLAANPTYPEVAITTQAVFNFWNPNTQQWVSSAPQAALHAFQVTSPVLALSSLRLLSVLPGPFRGPYNTIAGTKLEAISIVMQLGDQMQAGGTISLTFNQGPVNFNKDATKNAPPLLQPPADVAQIILATGTTGTAPLLAVGPGCPTRLGSVNCCSQSTAQVVKPFVSQTQYPQWLTSIVITLGPAGCVIPADRRFFFDIPSFYTGVNPSTLVVDAVAKHLPGYQLVDVFAWTSVEGGRHWLNRFSEPCPIGWYSGWQGSTINSPVLSAALGPVPPLGSSTVDFIGEAPGLDNSILATTPDITLVGYFGPWASGLSTVNALQVTIDTAVAGIQPQAMVVRITINAPWQARVADSTPYYIFVTASQGIFRANIGAITKPIQLINAQPAACASALGAMTTALTTLIIAVVDAGCIAALATTNTVIEIPLSDVFLLPNPPAGSEARFDVRIIPPMVSVSADAAANVFAPGGLRVTGDTAALMNVLAYSTVADCRTMTYQPGTVTDVSSLSVASRCQLVSTIAWISPVTTGFLQCNPGANVNNAQHLITYAKYGETYWAPKNWPTPNVGAEWPQNVGLAGTPAISMRAWGIMFSTPMFAIVVSYPPTLDNLKALGVTPTIPAGWQLTFLLKMDRMTVACSSPNEPNPWSFCTTGARAQAVTFFPASPAYPQGTPLEGWGQRTNGVCVTVPADGAVAGFVSTSISPTGDDSDGAWYAFFALFALPLLLLLCCLCALLYFLKLRKPKTCCPAQMGGTPVQEMYWVNAPAAGEMYMQPAGMPSPMASSHGAPMYMLQ